MFNRHEKQVHDDIQIVNTAPTVDKSNYLKCRANCGLLYKTKATRNRY